MRLSASNFAVEQHVHRQLPPATISHDGKRLLDPPTLVPVIRELMLEIGNPEFTDPVHLGIYTPWTTTQLFQLGNAPSLRQMLMDHVRQQQLFQDEEDAPVLQHSLLWQQGEAALVTYGLLNNEQIRDYCTVFYEAGLKIKTIDILPFCVLRGLAGSGVLDALLHKTGPTAIWGCFGVSGSQTWCTLWQGTYMLFYISFTTPADAQTWEERLLEPIQQLGLDFPAVWLAWHEAGMPPPINPLHLKLKAPIRPALLGPFYGTPPHQPSAAAIGAALKAEIPFPFQWDFLSDPTTDTLKKDYVLTPYTNYQPILPRLFLIVALLGLLGVIGGSIFLIRHNQQAQAQFITQETRIETFLNTVSQNSTGFNRLFAWINTKVIAGIQLEALQIEHFKLVRVEGKTFVEDHIHQFVKLLATPSKKGPFQLKQKQLSVTSESTSPPAFRFVFEGEIQPVAGQDKNPKASTNKQEASS